MANERKGCLKRQHSPMLQYKHASSTVVFQASIARHVMHIRFHSTYSLCTETYPGFCQHKSLPLPGKTGRHADWSCEVCTTIVAPAMLSLRTFMLCVALITLQPHLLSSAQVRSIARSARGLRRQIIPAVCQRSHSSTAMLTRVQCVACATRTRSTLRATTTVPQPHQRQKVPQRAQARSGRHWRLCFPSTSPTRSW
jgi:hypothetical protein